MAPTGMPDSPANDVLYIFPSGSSGPSRRRLLSRKRFRYPLLASVVVFTPLINYFLWALIGLLPVNRGFLPAPEGVEILVGSNGFHTDLYLPVANEIMDWRDFLPADAFSASDLSATHVGFGWGDAQFYTETPTWASLKTSTLLQAFFTPTPTVVHAELRRLSGVPDRWHSVMISQEQYMDLVQKVLSSFQQEWGQPILLPGESYGDRDAFFHGSGSYHCFKTCHSWAGGCLRSAGVKTGWYTPLPGTPTLYLPEPSQDERRNHLYSVFEFDERRILCELD